MTTKLLASALAGTLLVGCATTQKRFWTGAGVGAAAAGTSAVVLSPNSESRGLNALVFGLSGALVGGAIGLWATPSSEVPPSNYRLQSAAEAPSNSTSLSTAAPTDLPDFLKDRFKPAVIESYVESDSIGEDGSLHEPHRVYRIKQPSELITKPTPRRDQGDKP